MMTEKCDAFGRVTHCDTFLQELFLCFSRWWFSRKKASQCVTDGKASRLLSRSSSPYTSGGYIVRTCAGMVENMTENRWKRAYMGYGENMTENHTKSGNFETPRVGGADMSSRGIIDTKNGVKRR
jgi:hypothetical protein